MLPFYRIGDLDLRNEPAQGPKVLNAHMGLLCQAHRTALGAVEHPRRNL
jgi:hypothetical protein